jgi:hypothetical protein
MEGFELQSDDDYETVCRILPIDGIENKKLKN